MEKLLVVFVVALAANGVVCRPQSNNNDDTLDDRYGQIFDLNPSNQGNSWNSNPSWNSNQWNSNQPWNPTGNRPNRPNRPNIPTPRPAPVPTPSPAPTGSTTVSPAITACMLTCPVTSEYNPVCGTNNVVYPNPGRLQCARDCGLNVSLLRQAPCPVVTTAAPSR